MEKWILGPRRALIPLLVLFMSNLLSSTAWGAAPAPKEMTVEKTDFVICKEPGRYVGWPTVARTADGEILVVFSGDREAHICPYGKTQLVRSRDGGKTWSAPETINDTPLDDRDAGVLVTHQGTLLVSWFTSLAFEQPEFDAGNDRARWRDPIAKLSDGDRRRWLGHWLRRSEDGGRTWGLPVNTIVSSPHGPIELRDGRLLYLGLTALQGTAQLPKPAPERRMAAAESRDDGRTWRVVGYVPVPEGVPVEGFSELHAVETAAGKLVGMLRRDWEPGAGYLWQTESEDAGKTWSVPHQTRLWGRPPHLLRLHDGRLLASYGYRREPFGARACLSPDGGKTWDVAHEIVLRDDAPNGDLGYASSVQLDEATVLTVYYQTERAGEKTCVMGTRWKLPKP